MILIYLQYFTMITFYQWNKTFKTLASNLIPLTQETSEFAASKNDDLLINGYRRKTRKSCKQKAMSQHLKRQEKKQLKIQQNDELKQQQTAPFKNLAIQQRLKTLSPEKNDEIIKNTLRISKINVKQCEISINKYLRKRAKEGFLCSQRKKSSNQTKLIMQKKVQSYRSISQKSQAKNEEKTIENLSMIAKRSLGRQLKHDLKLKQPSLKLDQYHQSNLILNHQSLLNQLLKIQQKKQEKMFANSQLNRSRKNSKTENIEEEPTFLSPSRVNTSLRDEGLKVWKGYRKSASNYKTSYGDSLMKESSNHKKSLQTISITLEDK